MRSLPVSIATCDKQAPAGWLANHVRLDRGRTRNARRRTGYRWPYRE